MCCEINLKSWGESFYQIDALAKQLYHYGELKLSLFFAYILSNTEYGKLCAMFI